MRQICNPITAPFEDFDLVVEALDKTARLAAHEVVRDLLHPVLQGCQEPLEASEPAVADTPHPAFNRRSPGFFGVVGLEDAGQLLAQIVGSLQVRRAFEQPRQLFTLWLAQLFRITAERPPRPFQRFGFFFADNWLYVRMAKNVIMSRVFPK